jgi:hypothetical protein
MRSVAHLQEVRLTMLDAAATGGTAGVASHPLLTTLAPPGSIARQRPFTQAAHPFSSVALAGECSQLKVAGAPAAGT